MPTSIPKPRQLSALAKQSPTLKRFNGQELNCVTVRGVTFAGGDTTFIWLRGKRMDQCSTFAGCRHIMFWAHATWWR